MDELNTVHFQIYLSSPNAFELHDYEKFQKQLKSEVSVYLKKNGIQGKDEGLFDQKPPSI